MLDLKIGRMDAAFHCRGTIGEASDKSNMSDKRAARKGAPICKNQAGIFSRPIDVGRNVSRTPNNLYSMMWLV